MRGERLARRGDIQGLRAVAVLMVVAYHSGAGASGGYVGVDVFFVISGYVIARGLLQELANTGTVDLRRFYVRRARRLLPALAFMLIPVLILSRYLAPIGGLGSTSRTGAAAALFNANNYLATLDKGYFNARLELNALLHTWSLSVEEQFYFVFPILLIGVWGLARFVPRLSPRMTAGITLGLIAAASLGLALYIVYESGWGSTWAFYLAPARAWEFVAGTLLALGARKITPVADRFGAGIAAVGATLLVWSSLAYDPSTVFPGVAVMVPVAGTAMLIAAGEGTVANPVSRALACGPAQLLGDLSYGWYLWHWPAIVFALAWFPTTPGIAVAAAVGSLLPAFVSYYVLESPIKRARSASLNVTIALAAFCTVVPFIAAVGLEIGRDSGGEREAMAPFAPHVDVADGCDSTIPIGDRDNPKCEWIVDNAAGHAVLIGDSQAGQFVEGFVDAMTANGFSATVASQSGCPFVDLKVETASGADRCRRFVTQSTADLIEMRPTIVVIASASDLYLNGSYRFSDPDSETSTSTTFRSDPARETAWKDGLLRVVDALTDAGIEVAVVHPTPKIPGWDPRACAVERWRRSPSACSDTLASEAARASTQSGLRAESAVVEAAGIRALDLFEDICPTASCSAGDGTNWVLRDGNHISVEASHRLAPRFAELLTGL